MRARCIVRRVNPALETLLLPFSKGDLAVPSRAFFMGAEPADELRTWPDILGWQPFRPLADAWERAGFARVDEPSGQWPVVLLLPGKSKDATLADFAHAHDLLEPGGTMVVSMPNLAGAPRFEKELEKVAGNLESRSKRKCRVFHAVKNSAWNEKLLSAWRATGERRVVGGFTVRAGIFSPEHADPGSALLLEHLPGDLRGVVADLGAGWGYLAKGVADRSRKIKGLHLYEADARALECARINLGEGPYEFHWHDITAGLPGKYDEIVCNPPFHTGQTMDVELGLAFLRIAAGALRVGGRLFIVANRQLPYEAEMDALGLVWKRPVETATYKLLFAQKRMASRPVTFPSQ